MSIDDIFGALTDFVLGDDIFLSLSEKRSLAALLHNAKAQTGDQAAVLSEAITRSVGETITRRVCEKLGLAIVNRLMDPTRAGSNGSASPHEPSLNSRWTIRSNAATLFEPVLTVSPATFDPRRTGSRHYSPPPTQGPVPGPSPWSNTQRATPPLNSVKRPS